MTLMPQPRIVHIHIPKTAGTYLRHALVEAYGENMRVFDQFDGRSFKDVRAEDYDFFSGHLGYAQAEKLGGKKITILRDPVERFVSMYYFLRQLYNQGTEKSEKTRLASRFSLSEFVRIRDEPVLVEALFNAMAWQVGYGHNVEYRRLWRSEGKTEEDLFQAAKSNLANLFAFGFQDDIAGFVSDLSSKLNISLKVWKENTTSSRAELGEISADVLRSIHEWTYMDLELYRHAKGVKR